MAKDGDHKDHASAVFHYNANKVTYDAISYARIQATNAYLKSIGQPVVDGKRGSLAIYLTEDQYKEVIHLRVIFFQLLVYCKPLCNLFAIYECRFVFHGWKISERVMKLSANTRLPQLSLPC